MSSISQILWSAMSSTILSLCGSFLGLPMLSVGLSETVQLKSPAIITSGQFINLLLSCAIVFIALLSFLYGGIYTEIIFLVKPFCLMVIPTILLAWNEPIICMLWLMTEILAWPNLHL